MRAGLRRSLQERWLLPRLVADVLAARPPPSQPRAERPATAGVCLRQCSITFLPAESAGRPEQPMSERCIPLCVVMFSSVQTWASQQALVTTGNDVFLLDAVEELATLFAGSPDTADDRLEATAAACTGGDCTADPLQTLRALRYAIFAVDAALREALHNSADSSSGSGSGSNTAENGASPSTGADPAAPEADPRHSRGLRLMAHLEVLLTDAAGHVVAEVDRARDVGLLDGGAISVAIALIGEEALWLGMCCQVRSCTRPGVSCARSSPYRCYIAFVHSGQLIARRWFCRGGATCSGSRVKSRGRRAGKRLKQVHRLPAPRQLLQHRPPTG